MNRDTFCDYCGEFKEFIDDPLECDKCGNTENDLKNSFHANDKNWSLKKND